MIRISRGFLTVLATTALLAAAIPLGAQAGIFINKKQNTEGAVTGKTDKNGFYVPHDTTGSKVFNPNKYNQREQSLGGKFTDKDIKNFDPGLLSSAGGEPRTVQELMMMAAAHNAVKNNALAEMRAGNQMQLAQSQKELNQAQNENRSQANIKKLMTDSPSAGVEAPPAKRPGRRIFVKPSTGGEAKPRGVFKNY